MNYFDTSALLKRFAAERGSEEVRAIMTGGASVATAKIAYAEVYGSLTRKKREGDLSGKEYALACRNFEEDWRAYVRIDLTDEVLVLSRDLIKRHPLRGFDAIHLASALSLARTLGERMTFVAADARLLRVAEAERLAVINPEADTE